MFNLLMSHLAPQAPEKQQLIVVVNFIWTCQFPDAYLPKQGFQVGDWTSASELRVAARTGDIKPLEF